MKLDNTDKYFPKTYHYLKTTYGDNPKSTHNKSFIKNYSLSGLSVLDPQKAKEVKVLPNDVDEADDKVVASVKKFNDDLNLMAKDYCLFVCPKDTNAVLLDHAIFDSLDEFVTSHYDISDNLRKYVNADDLILNDIKSGRLKVVCQKDDKYTVYDIYEPAFKFNYSVAELNNLEVMLVSKNAKGIQTITDDTKNKLNKDSSLFNDQLKPLLPLLMNDDLDYYNKLVKHGRLLHILCIQLHV